MAISCVDSLLVRPGLKIDGLEQSQGTRIPHSGKLFAMLSDLYERALRECNIDIAFQAAEDGTQENPCRELLLHHLRRPTAHSAHAIAKRLSGVTGRRSGLGLLFILCGRGKYGHRMVLARFPADQGVLAEERGGALEVQFIEKVFMKSAHAYKSVSYTAPSLAAGFMRGKAIDKQINGPREVSLYWINEFLASELATTGAAGTRRLGNAIKAAVRDTRSGELRGKLVSAAQLIPSHSGKKITASKLLKSIGLPDDGIAAVRNAMGRAELMDERFELSADEFALVAPYRSVELDNGAMLLAETTNFGTVFDVRKVAEGRTRYSTEGQVVSERLRKQK